MPLVVSFGKWSYGLFSKCLFPFASSSSKTNFNAIPAAKTAAMDRFPLRYKVRSCAMLNSAEKKRYTVNRDDGRTDLGCSIDDRITIDTEAIRSRIEAANDARVWLDLSVAQITRRTRSNITNVPAATCAMLAWNCGKVHCLKYLKRDLKY